MSKELILESLGEIGEEFDHLELDEQQEIVEALDNLTTQLTADMACPEVLESKMQPLHEKYGEIDQASFARAVDESGGQKVETYKAIYQQGGRECEVVEFSVSVGSDEKQIERSAWVAINEEILESVTLLSVRPKEVASVE